MHGRKVFFQHVCGTLPSSGCLRITYVAVTATEIGDEFAGFCSPLWVRDKCEDQFCADSWTQFQEILDETPIPIIPQIHIHLCALTPG